MDAATTTDATGPSSPGPVQLAFYAIDDPLWLGVLLHHLHQGGCIVVERTGDLLILPGPT
jgi:hypothetical protein